MKHTKCYLPNYPRPQLVRSDWVNLNGEWAFAFGEEVQKQDALNGKLSKKINVPFSYETKASGIEDGSMHREVWYSTVISGKKGKRAILHFDGADYVTTVFINGKQVGTHTGAYTRFSFDVTDHLTKKENVLTVQCIDDNHPSQVRGKQRWEGQSFGCWYVQTTGIYKSVWMEFVDKTYLNSLKITPSVVDYSVRFDFSVSAPADDVEVRFDVSYNGNKISSAQASACDISNSVTIGLDSAKFTYQVDTWAPWNPALYDVDITVIKAGKQVDAAGSYFGLREFVAKDGKLLLNNQVFYEKLVLDQGYWPDTGITPPDEEAIIKDIQLCKDMGFNGARKHQKVEDERFFYYADIMGYVVWCELPSNHWYCDQSSRLLADEWLDIVKQYYNFPSLITWVIFNESWGVRNIQQNKSQQSLADGLYYLTKSIDGMRPVISNDGWMHAKSDILTLHHYEQDGEALFGYYDSDKKLQSGCAYNCHFLPFTDGTEYEGQPIVISEFGGTAYVADEQSGWGYGVGVKNDEEYVSRLKGLIDAIKKMQVSGFCYTQITDVQQEVNGLLKEDRTPKVSTDRIKEINK